jgi:hypothetical protein
MCESESFKNGGKMENYGGGENASKMLQGGGIGSQRHSLFSTVALSQSPFNHTPTAETWRPKSKQGWTKSNVAQNPVTLN